MAYLKTTLITRVRLLVSGVVQGELKVEYGEDTREFIPNKASKQNPNFNPKANAQQLIDEKERDKAENWLALALTLIGCIPTFGSAMKWKCKVALKATKGTSKDTLLTVLRGMGKGDPEKFLRSLDWMDYAK